MSLLFCVIYDRLKRLPRSLADHLFFKIPLLGELVEASGAREGTPENARGLLEAQELVSVAPGGMREALRPSQERYQVLWEHRKGFVKLALETQTPIILAFCPKADDLYDVYSSPLTQWAYQTFKIPVPLIRGLGPTFIPKPIALTHFIDKPIQPPLVTKDKRRRAGQLDRFHGEVLKKAQELMARAVAHRGASSW
jgi:1-acyl-sn-glycerol-3-phosphate acyltransferase